MGWDCFDIGDKRSAANEQRIMSGWTATHPKGDCEKEHCFCVVCLTIGHCIVNCDVQVRKEKKAW